MTNLLLKNSNVWVSLRFEPHCNFAKLEMTWCKTGLCLVFSHPAIEIRSCLNRCSSCLARGQQFRLEAGHVALTRHPDFAKVIITRPDEIVGGHEQSRRHAPP